MARAGAVWVPILEKAMAFSECFASSAFALLGPGSFLHFSIEKTAALLAALGAKMAHAQGRKTLGVGVNGA